MSEHFIALTPIDPKAEVPKEGPALRDAVANILGTDEVRLKDYGKLQFIDCGQNFNTVSCPSCQSEIGQEQWHTWMDEDWHGEEGFHLHRHQTPCCDHEVTLNDLTYDMPQGFAHWMVSARAADLSESTLLDLSELAGTPLRLIRQRY